MRFLNAVGGGIVRRIDRDVVLVEEEDGFETPVLARECVVIESGRKQDNGIVPTDKQEIARHAARPVVPRLADDDDEPELPLVETRKGERISLYLAFVPESCSRLGSTTFDAYLINDSNYYLDYLYGRLGRDGRVDDVQPGNGGAQCTGASRKFRSGLGQPFWAYLGASRCLQTREILCLQRTCLDCFTHRSREIL